MVVGGDGELAALERGWKEGGCSWLDGWTAGGAVYMLGFALRAGLGAECCVRYFCQLTPGICDYCPHAEFEPCFEATRGEYAIWLRRHSRGIPRTDAVGRGICVRPTVLFSLSLSISTSSGVDGWAFLSVVW